MSQQRDYWKAFSEKHTGGLRMFDRNAEIIFGLIMVLTFTCTLSAANAGREEIRTIIWAAIGCNTAWGLVDALMVLLAAIVERSDAIKLLRQTQNAPDEASARTAVKDALPPLFAEITTDQQLGELAGTMRQLPHARKSAFLTWQDGKNAMLVFLLVFLSTFPVVIPFFFIHEVIPAVRVSNGIALLLLFTFGYRLGAYAGFNRFVSGLGFSLIGAVLVWVTIMLGG
jgi:VIT1/CCC1 family predicted Fe2+/Mn2+ transporter